MSSVHGRMPQRLNEPRTSSDVVAVRTRPNTFAGRRSLFRVVALDGAGIMVEKNNPTGILIGERCPYRTKLISDAKLNGLRAALALPGNATEKFIRNSQKWTVILADSCQSATPASQIIA